MSSRAPRDARRTTHTFAIRLTASAAIALATLAAGAACTATREARAVKPPTASETATDDSSSPSLAEGKRVFREDTFGDEQYWTDTLHLNEVIEKAVDPTTALNGVLHRSEETGMDDAYAARTATLKYRTTPLRALWQHAPYFHDGSAATLADVVAHYDRVRKLGLSTARKHDLVEYLKSL